jgi:hypothetical protein
MIAQTAKETLNICFLQAAKTHKTALKAVLQSTYCCPQHALRHAIFLCCSACFFSCSWVHSVRVDHDGQRSFSEETTLPSPYYERSLVSRQRTVHRNGQSLARPSASSVSHVCSYDLLQRGKRKNQGNSSESRPWPRRALGSSSCRFS